MLSYFIKHELLQLQPHNISKNMRSELICAGTSLSETGGTSEIPTAGVIKMVQWKMLEFNRGFI